jgi:hypothetical protein
MTELADRIFCIYGEQVKGRKAEAKMHGDQGNIGGILLVAEGPVE